ncbi:MAG: DUF5808 domain-containing protein [Ignavibacteriales bacterium]|nr:DUF5808 domain-containing protein [Ignavibacteriales bacterium]
MTEDQNDNSHWKLGIIYFNPKNEKVFVPKRIGIGWTINFATWQAKLILATFIVIILVAIIKPFH